MPRKQLTQAKFNAGVRFQSSPLEEYEAPSESDFSLEESNQQGSQPQRVWQPPRNVSKNAGNTQRRAIQKRKKPKQRVLREIAKLQQTTKLSIPKAPFGRLVKEVLARETRNRSYRSTRVAVESLHEVSEDKVVRLIQFGNEAAHSAKRVTLKPSDLELIRKIQKAD